MSLTSLAFAKSLARVASTNQDAFLQTLLDGAEDWCARYCGIYLSSEETLPTVSNELLDGGGLTLIPIRLPVIQVTEIKDTLDSSNTALESTTYSVRPAGVIRIDRSRWRMGLDLWKMTYKGGYTAATLPPGFNLCVAQLFTKAYKAAGDLSSEGSGVPGAVTSWNALTDGDLIAILDGYRFGTIR